MVRRPCAPVRQKNTGVSGARRRGIRRLGANGSPFSIATNRVLAVPIATGGSRRRQPLCRCVAWLFGDLRVITDEGPGQTLYEKHGLSIAESPHIFADSLTVQFPFQFGMLQGSWIRRSALVDLECFNIDLRSDDDLFAGFQVACRYRVAAIPAIVGTYFRTSDLNAGSVVFNGVYGPDHYRSRMLSFATVIETGRRRPWNVLYASEVRGFARCLSPRAAVLTEYGVRAVPLRRGYGQRNCILLRGDVRPVGNSDVELDCSFPARRIDSAQYRPAGTPPGGPYGSAVKG